jgi:hypothetical protein
MSYSVAGAPSVFVMVTVFGFPYELTRWYPKLTDAGVALTFIEGGGGPERPKTWNVAPG